LNVHKVRYLIVDGYAYAIHAEPRYTKDLDIFYEASENNAQRMLSCLKEFGFGSLDIKADDLMMPGRIIQLGVPPLRIDLINEIEGVAFSEAWNGKITAEYGGESINVIGKLDLIRNKKMTGREQDLLDAKRLEEE